MDEITFNNDDLHNVCFLIMNVQNLIVYSDGKFDESELWILSSYLSGVNKMPLEPLNKIFKLWNEKGVSFTTSISDDSIRILNKFITEEVNVYSDEAFKNMFEKGLKVICQLSDKQKYDFVTGVYGLTLHITHADSVVDKEETLASLDIMKYFLDKLDLPSNLVLTLDKDFRNLGGDENFIYQ